MEIFLKANPQIHDPDLIQPGDMIAFPLMQLEVDYLAHGNWWIQLARHKTLAEAYSVMLLYSGLENKIRLIPVHNGAGEMHFAIIVQEGFPSREDARVQLQMLPAAVAEEAEVVTRQNLGQPLFQLAGKRESVE